MRTTGVVAVLALAMLGACASSRGFNRGALREGLGPQVIDDAKIEEAFRLRPQLPRPFKLAVFIKEPAAREGKPRWRWSEEDKARILALGEEWKRGGEVEDVSFISADLVAGEDLKSIRYAAALQGADAVLVASGVEDVDAYHNNWAWTYLAVVTALLVPGNQADALFLARASLWDVRNGLLYLSAEGESVKKQTAPAAWIDERRLIEEARAESVTMLGAELANPFKKL
jgi:hypothetical protein